MQAIGTLNETHVHAFQGALSPHRGASAESRITRRQAFQQAYREH